MFAAKYTIDLPEVCSVEEIPGRGVADDFSSVRRLLEHRPSPERVRHRIESEGCEELFGHCKHTLGGVFLYTQRKPTGLFEGC